MQHSATTSPLAPHAPFAEGRHRVVGAQGEAIAPETLDRLEALDDTFFAALGGDPQALNQLADRWNEAVRTVDGNLVSESRRHYVHHAQNAWKRAKRQPEARLAQAFAALELLDLLTGRQRAS